MRKPCTTALCRIRCSWVRPSPRGWVLVQIQRLAKVQLRRALQKSRRCLKTAPRCVSLLPVWVVEQERVQRRLLPKQQRTWESLLWASSPHHSPSRGTFAPAKPKRASRPCAVQWTALLSSTTINYAKSTVTLDSATPLAKPTKYWLELQRALLKSSPTTTRKTSIYAMPRPS